MWESEVCEVGFIQFNYALALSLLGLGLSPPTEVGVFNAIVPGAGMTTGWFHKPGPTEFRNIWINSPKGIFPYHLNDIWNEGSGFGFDELKKRIGRDLTHNSLMGEIDAVERILLNQLEGKSSEWEETVLKIFGLKKARKYDTAKMSIWDTYGDALAPRRENCDKKYKLCPLTEEDISEKNILSGLF
ncbi:hypothetical protein Fcan01_26127 [Folsomia candida]|uniref:Uncharacterized protein n=1 Tax=Folsomia candida TaxID=158441 RepID=A0A226D2W7_FOLCA|nr:hypothetical protein Fcan01_26127 [Folsomia candida]